MNNMNIYEEKDKIEKEVREQIEAVIDNFNKIYEKKYHIDWHEGCCSGIAIWDYEEWRRRL